MNCYSIKMTQFISWLLNNEPRPDNWDDIHSEYIGLRENKSSLYILGLVKEIAYLKCKFDIINKCCKVMNVCFTAKLDEQAKELKDIFRSYGFRQAFPMDNEMLFSRDIRAVLSSNKRMVHTWERKEKEYEEYVKRHGGKEWQQKDFYMWAITLGEHQGYRIDLEVIVVAEWCQLMNRYEQYCEVKNAEQRGKQYGKRR